MSFKGMKITGTGSYLPPNRVTNDDLAKIVDTNDEWIRTRTGIEARHIADKSTPTSEIAAGAARKAIEAAGITPDDLDLIIVATIAPDQVFPNTACHVQRIIGANPNAMCFSLEAACTGFVYALETATAMIRSGYHKTALVIGAEKMSSLVDWDDRATCVLFGDGAGAAILQATDDVNDCALIGSSMHANGNYGEILEIPAGGSRMPITPELLAAKMDCVKMEGQQVFKLAVTSMVKACKKVLNDAGITVDELTWLVPHQANMRIISAVGKGLGIETSKVFINVDKYANTSSATVPIALDEIVRGNLVQRGDYMLCVAFGGGLTWGASLIKW
ncbi:MAG: ketoacyl-ACP synthase III [Lentisphaeria bacterium]|nr:ketoacyl-ACP synthase III [Lentisphaeria bacterium]